MLANWLMEPLFGPFYVWQVPVFLLAVALVVGLVIYRRKQM